MRAMHGREFVRMLIKRSAQPIKQASVALIVALIIVAQGFVTQKINRLIKTAIK